jgi:hypothetical protein
MRLQHIFFCLAPLAVSISCGSGNPNPSPGDGVDTNTPNPSGGGGPTNPTPGSDASVPTGGGGQEDSGSACVPKTCASLGYNCGSATDGCGGSLSCGTCTAPETCGGGGQTSVCGAPSDGGSGSDPPDGGSHDSGSHDSGSADTGGGSGGAAFIHADFSGTDNETIAGMSPDTVNLPGAKWQLDGVNLNGSFLGFVDTGSGNPPPALHLYDVGSSSGSASISIGSAGTYTKPAEFSIQADITTLAPSTILFLGFYATPPAAGIDTFTGLTGLALDTGNGSLALVEAGVTGTSIAFTGTYNAGAYTTLAYTVNTATGAISSVTFGSSTSHYDFSTTAFTDAATAFVAVGTKVGGPSGSCSYFDNLILK